MEKLFTVKEMAAYIGRKPSTIQRWVKLKQIPVIKIGRTIRFNRTQVMEHLTIQAKKL